MPNKKSKAIYYWLIGIAIYIATLFISLHINIIMQEQQCLLIEAIPYLEGHIVNSPFDIFPINIKLIGYISFFAAFFGFWAYIDIDRRKNKMVGREHGTAKWNNGKEFKKKFTEPEFHKNMILSQTEAMSMNTKKTRKNNNIVIVGGSGSGKSRFQVKPNILQANCSYVITDPSGELLSSTGSYLEKQGYQIKVFNLVEMAHSSRYNPFNYIRDEVGIRIMINTLIQNTTPAGASKGDPFWEKSETALLEAICLYLYYECNPEDRHFGNVIKLLRAAELKEGNEDYESQLDILFKKLESEKPNHIAVNTYKIFKQAGATTGKSILISAGVRLNVFNYEAIENLTKNDNIDLGSIGDKKTALFVIIPAADSTFNFLVSMMYSQLFETLYYHAETACDNKTLPVHVRFLLDEFANIGTIPDFEKKLATMRKYEISCTIILQNMAQLKAMYKDNWESITGNCDTLIYLGGKEQTTREYISKELGKRTIDVQNSSKSYGGKGGGSLSMNKGGRELMTADELGLLKDNECLVLIRGLNPFFSHKYEYTKHPNYEFTGDANKEYKYDYKSKFNTATKIVIDKPKNKAKEKLLKKAERRNIREEKLIDLKNSERITYSTEKGLMTYQPEDLTVETLNEIGINDIKDIKEKIEVIEDFATYEFGGIQTEDEFF